MDTDSKDAGFDNDAPCRIVYLAELLPGGVAAADAGDRTSPGAPQAMPAAPVVEIADAPEPSPDDPTGISERTLKETPPEQLGRVQGLEPDDAFWAITGVPNDWATAEEVGWGRVVLNHMAVRYVLTSLMFRPNGAFELLFRWSAIVYAPGMWASHTMYSPDAWSDWVPGSCAVTPAAAYALQDWFQAAQKAVDRARVLKHAMLDDEGVAAARNDLLAANRLDPETVAFERAARLVAVGLTDTALAQQRQQVITQALAAAGLDDESVARLRMKAYEEVTIDDEHLGRAIPRLIQRERLDDANIALRRELLLKEHGLA